MGSPTCLRITIIGAGIAGLTTALALRRLIPSSSVTMLEKSIFAQEIGAALYVGPNCSSLLIRLGVDLKKIGGNLCEGVVSVAGKSGEVVKRVDLKGVAGKWKAPWMLAHRRDLHDELKKLAVEAGAVLELGVRIVEVDVRSGKVTLGDGRAIEGDVVVGADGNNSFTREYVDDKPQLRSFGKTAYRWLVARDILERDDEIVHLESGNFADILGNDRKVVQYPCRANTVFNFVAFVPDEEATGAMDGWEAKGNKERLMRSFESFAPATRKLLTYAGDDLKIWTLADMDSLAAFHKERLALIGDAAHPFLPFLGQGAAQAMEDAVSLALVISNATDPSEIPDALQLYDGIRRERVEYIREATRTNGLDEDKGKPAPSWMFEMLDFCYTHDEWANTEGRAERWRQDRKGL